MQIKNQQLEPDMQQWTGSKLGKKYVKAVYCHSLFSLYSEYIMRNIGLDKAWSGVEIAGGNIHNLRYKDDTTLMISRKQREIKEYLDECERGEWKNWLKLSIQKTKIMASGLSFHGK